VSDAHGQHQRSGRRSYRIAGVGEWSALPSPTSIGHVEDLIPGYVLGALDAAEFSAVNTHVRICPSCERSLAEAQRTVGMLPFTVPMHTPSIDTKVALFSRVSHVQKAATAAALPTVNVEAFRTPTLPSSGFRDLAPAAPTGATSQGGGRRDSRFGWLASAISLPLLVALIATGFWGIQMRNQLSTQNTQLAELQSEFANFASGSASYPLQPGFDAPMAEGQIVMGANERDGFLQIDVNRKDGPQSYELLVNHDGQLESAGTVTVNGDGQGTTRFELAQPFEEYESVHIRAIAADGSPTGEGLDTLMRNSEGPLGSTGSGLDIGT
jgi:anti-sigma factor RsiW